MKEGKSYLLNKSIVNTKPIKKEKHRLRVEHIRGRELTDEEWNEYKKMVTKVESNFNR